MITIVDYGLGNIGSVVNACAYVGLDTEITQDPERVVAAEQLIVPGVGAFADAINLMRRLGLDQAVREAVKRRIPLLGICLGLQLLFTEGYENGIHQGLDILSGHVERFPDRGQKIPQVGWNSAGFVRDDPLGRAGEAPYFYFVHSYCVVPEDENIVLTTTDYGVPFVSAVRRGTLAATQFHPEKSGRVGLNLLKMFGRSGPDDNFSGY
jgi:glutamine amidotransferase